ncbi:hypothetical protein GCM10011362_19070 [Marinobacter halophilus]|nr:hypothetical protein GCM10011362_19070 [Marinobacter halophilus]
MSHGLYSSLRQGEARLSQVQRLYLTLFVTREYQRMQPCLVLDQGYTIPQARMSLGVTESAIVRWLNQLVR